MSLLCSDNGGQLLSWALDFELDSVVSAMRRFVEERGVLRDAKEFFNVGSNVEATMPFGDHVMLDSLDRPPPASTLDALAIAMDD
ncbi:hypothetical protein V2A60_002308 [Cordyceps javanica]